MLCCFFVCLFVGFSLYVCIFFLFYPCGNCDAPICCPGASTWQTTKCLVISCMSSLLKKVLKQSLSAGGEEIIRGGTRWQDRNTRRKKRGWVGERMEGWRAEECDNIKYASHSERTMKVAIWTSDPMPEAEGSSQQIKCQTTFIYSCFKQTSTGLQYRLHVIINNWNALIGFFSQGQKSVEKHFYVKLPSNSYECRAWIMFIV